MKPHILAIICVLITFQISCTNNNKTRDHVKITDQGVNIAYTDSGYGDTTLLFVHGWCINKTYWINQVNYFSKKYRVITVDLPGFGLSGKNRTTWTTEAYSRDIDSVMEQLNLKNVILVGHSMAGDIVLQSAVNTPGRVIGLVGIDNFKNFGHVESKADKASFDQAIDSLKHHFKKLAFEYVNQALFYKTTPAAVRKKVLNDVANADTVIAAACMQENGFNEKKQLGLVKRKLYLINSDVNPTDTTGFRAEHIPYQVFYIHATGHFPMIEKPQEFNLLLSKVIKNI